MPGRKSSPKSAGNQSPKPNLQVNTVQRDYGDAKYTAWRAKVKARDGHRCKLCNAADNHKPFPFHNIEVHHIVRWKDQPKLRFVVSNGITLCRICHDYVTGNEERFADAFRKLISEKNKSNRIVPSLPSSQRPPREGRKS